jgi:hypothetical protein
LAKNKDGWLTRLCFPDSKTVHAVALFIALSRKLKLDQDVIKNMLSERFKVSSNITG